MNNPWAYNEIVKEHFTNPKNILDKSVEEYNPDGIGNVGSPACGDMMQILVKIDEKDRITDLKWQTFGCASAIASTSMLSEMVTEKEGMHISDAYKITPEEIIKRLGGLPANKIHCSVLGDKALRAAIDDFLEKNGRENPYADHTSPIICECLNISEEDIRMEVLEGAKDFHTLQDRTKICTVCKKCRLKTEAVLDKYVEKYYKDEVYNPDK